jgi:23S rRNA maturation-related 3'-5' exoribonuclease YhaM
MKMMSIAVENPGYFYQQVPVQSDVPQEKRDEILYKFQVPKLSPQEGMLNLDHENHGNVISRCLLLLNDYSVQTASNGNPFLKMFFSNSSGNISAKMWDNQGAVERALPLLEQHSLFYISAKVEEFPRGSGNKSLTIQQMEPCEQEVHPFSLLPCTSQSLEDFTVELFCYLDELEEPHRSVGLAGMTRFWKEFVLRPAAKGHHHNYLGGLLKHTVGLMRLARYILDGEESYFKRMIRLIRAVETEHKKEVWENYQSESPVDSRKLVWNGTIDHLYSIFNSLVKYKEESPNRSVVISSIFYHDIGKLIEYTHVGKGLDEFKFLYPTASIDSLESRKPTGITMDPLGALIGHMPYGVLLLSKVLEVENIAVTIDDIHLYNHCILSHHGKHEWQSTVTPATPEAFILHFVDFLDSRYERAEEIK